MFPVLTFFPDPVSCGCVQGWMSFVHHTTPEVDELGQFLLFSISTPFTLCFSIYRLLRGLIIAFKVVQMAVSPFWPKDHASMHLMHGSKHFSIRLEPYEVACSFPAHKFLASYLLDALSDHNITEYPRDWSFERAFLFRLPAALSGMG